LNPSSAKLLRIIIPVVSVVTFQAVLSTGSLELMSAVRAYVTGESFWSKGQKDAIRFIQLYAATGDATFLKLFDAAIAAPLGDLTARRALEQPPINLERARQGFLDGGNKPDDVERLTWLFRFFRNTPYMRDAIQYWRETDATLGRLVALRGLIEQQSEQGLKDQNRQAWRAEIDSIDQQLAPRAIAFSESLGTGSKSINRLLTAINLTTAVLLIGFVVLRLRRILAAQMAAQQQLMLEQEKAAHTLSSIGEAVIVVSGDGHITFANPAASRLLGVTGELEHIPAASLLSFREQQAASTLIAATEHGDPDGCAPPSQILVRSDGSSVPVSVSRSELRHAQDGGYVLVIRDMTEERNLLDRIAWQASHDALTELANRRHLEFQLEREMARAEANGGTLVLIFADLDQFKIVNDTSGHAAGDRLLRHAAGLFKDVIGDRGLVARLGGDEFGMLFRVQHTEEAISLAERLRTEIERHATVYDGTSFRTTGSIGVVFTRDVASPADALRAADVACFLAKEKGRNRVQIHRPTDEDIESRVNEMSWVQILRDALEHNQLCLFAQEVRALHEERSKPHFELLLRLRQGGDRVLSPGSFLPAAERYGLMPLIDRWVIRAAFEQIARLDAEEPAIYAINISGVTLGDRKFVNYVADELVRHRIDPACICFEITETSAIANLHDAKFFIEAFRGLGCGFSLDDFGTGMSSIAYLKHFPVDYLKIDGSFVKEMLSSSVDRAMVEMITKTAKILGMKVVAEFVESREIIEALKAIGVDYAQGYAIGKPAPFPRLQDSRADQMRVVA
jgi:diguanylate cyclase (GGDEF)-like protein/PAS domain S-box-containing protein